MSSADAGVAELLQVPFVQVADEGGWCVPGSPVHPPSFHTTERPARSCWGRVLLGNGLEVIHLEHCCYEFY